MSKQTTGNNKHTHKIKKAGPVWKCVKLGEDCSFFVYFKQEYVLFGRNIICWTCGSEFPFSEQNLTEDMPICVNCRNPEFDDLENLIDTKIKQSQEDKQT